MLCIRGYLSRGMARLLLECVLVCVNDLRLLNKIASLLATARNLLLSAHDQPSDHQHSHDDSSDLGNIHVLPQVWPIRCRGEVGR